MEELTSFASIPAIMFITYYISLIYKYFVNHEKQAIESLVVGSAGLVLGVISYYISPHVIHSDNVLAAAATGIASGLASMSIQKFRG